MPVFDGNVLMLMKRMVLQKTVPVWRSRSAYVCSCCHFFGEIPYCFRKAWQNCELVL